MTSLDLNQLELDYISGDLVLINWITDLKFEDKSIRGWKKSVTTFAKLGTPNDEKEYFINKYLNENQDKIDDIIKTNPSMRKLLDDARTVEGLKKLLNDTNNVYRKPVFKKQGNICFENISSGEVFLAIDLDYIIECGLHIPTVYLDSNGNAVKESDLPSPIKKRVNNVDGPHYTFPLRPDKVISLTYKNNEYIK